MAAPHEIFVERVEREQKAAAKHIQRRLHPGDEDRSPQTNIRDSCNTSAELMHGFYRMPISIKGHSRQKRFVLRGIRAVRENVSDATSSMPSTVHTAASSNQDKKLARCRSVGSAASMQSAVTQSVHSGIACSVHSKDRRSKGDECSILPGSAISRHSKSVDHIIAHRSVSECNSARTRSLSSLRPKSTVTENASVGRSEVQKYIHEQVSELLKPLKREIALTRKARIAAENRLKNVDEAIR